MRGPQVMTGYLNNPEATAATIDEDGWLHSGDVAVVDSDGYFQIVDRLKELIKYKGFQVAPAELEALILGHEHVGDVAVIGVPDEEAGELPKAFVVAGLGRARPRAADGLGRPSRWRPRSGFAWSRPSRRSPSRPRARSCAACSRTARRPQPG